VTAVANPFFDALALGDAGGGRYTAQLADRWNLKPLPQGGIVTAIAVRAMETRLAHDEQRPRTLHTVFAARVADGPLEIEVEILRAGRSMSQLRAEVRNPGAARGHLTTCSFGAPRAGFSFTDLEAPAEIPPPEACPSFRDPLPPEASGFEPMPFWSELVEGRAVVGHPPWEEHDGNRAQQVTWYRFDDAPVLGDGRLDPLALIVLADTMPGAVGQRVARDPAWFAPSVDLTVHLLADCRSDWVLADNRARFAGDGYASADMALWDCGDDGQSNPRLVAYATQLFLFSFLAPST